MIMQVIPQDKKKYTERLTAEGFTFSTLAKAKKVDVVVEFDDENYDNLVKFMAINDENL